MAAHEEEIIVDAIILAEMCMGVLALPRGRKRARLEQWLETVAGTIECLPWDAATSRRWAKLAVELKAKGRTLPLLDSMIAATALEHGLIVATRNISDFKRAGVKAVNPFT